MKTSKEIQKWKLENEYKDNARYAKAVFALGCLMIILTFLAAVLYFSSVLVLFGITIFIGCTIISYQWVIINRIIDLKLDGLGK